MEIDVAVCRPRSESAHVMRTQTSDRRHRAVAIRTWRGGRRRRGVRSPGRLPLPLVQLAAHPLQSPLRALVLGAVRRRRRKLRRLWRRRRACERRREQGLDHSAAVKVRACCPLAWWVSPFAAGYSLEHPFLRKIAYDSDLLSCGDGGGGEGGGGGGGGGGGEGGGGGGGGPVAFTPAESAGYRRRRQTTVRVFLEDANSRKCRRRRGLFLSGRRRRAVCVRAATGGRRLPIVSRPTEALAGRAGRRRGGGARDHCVGGNQWLPTSGIPRDLHAAETIMR